MKFKMTRIGAAAVLAFAPAGAMAIAYDSPLTNFTMYDPIGAVVGDFNDVMSWVDWTAMTFGVASPSPLFGANWTASGGTLFGPGNYTISTVDPAPGVSGGTYNVTVGEGQIGGHIDFAWGVTTGIDVVMVWDLVPAATPGFYWWVPTNWVSTDWDGDSIPGVGMIDGPFQGFSANVATAVPEASSYAMILVGVGLVGAAAARRQRPAVQSRGMAASDFQKP